MTRYEFLIRAGVFDGPAAANRAEQLAAMCELHARVTGWTASELYEIALRAMAKAWHGTNIAEAVVVANLP